MSKYLIDLVRDIPRLGILGLGTALLVLPVTNGYAQSGIAFKAPTIIAMASKPAEPAVTTPITNPGLGSTLIPTPTAPKAEAQYCPAASQLKKENQRWAVDDKWKSYNQSFAQNISAFLGAQWLGIKIGKIICLYSGDNKIDFPIALEATKTSLILSPTGQNWRELKSGYRRCQSNNVHDCPFFKQPPQDTTNVYEQIQYKEAPGASRNLDDKNLMYNR